MKLTKAISIFGEKHGKKADGSEHSFDELLAQFAEEQNDKDSPSDAAEGGAASEAKKTKRSFFNLQKPEDRAQERHESAILRALGTRRATIIRIALAAALLLLTSFVDMPQLAVIFIKIAAALIVGYDLILKAVSDACRLDFVGGTMPVLAAAIVYLCIGRGTEAVIALVVFKIAVLALEYISEHIHAECRKSFENYDSSGICEGDTIDLGESMTCPVDCEVIAGSASADMSSITGDRSAVSLTSGSFVPAGSVILRGIMTAKALSTAEGSLSAVVARTLLNGAHTKTEAGKKALSTARAIVLSVFFIATVLLLILPFALQLPIKDSLARVATVLAVAAPGSLLLSVPQTFFVGMTSARRIGIVFRKAADLEKTAAIKSVVFDKVGTITGHEYVVSDIATDRMDPQTFLKVAAYAEAGCDDPIARAIVAAYGQDISGALVENFVSFDGRGVSVTVDGIQIFLGSQGFLAEQGISLPRLTNDSLAVHMTVNGIYAGRIVLSDYIVPTANATINRLSQSGVERVTMMSTDNRERDLAISKELGIDEYIAECPPTDRPRRVKEMKARIDPRSTLAYVSANADAKDCFAAADVGIAVGGINQPRLLELADVTIMSPAPDNLSAAVTIAQGVERYIRLENVFTVFSKLLVVLLSAFGFIPLWLAVLIDGAASVGVLLDSRSALRLGGAVSYGDFLR